MYRRNSGINCDIQRTTQRFSTTLFENIWVVLKYTLLCNLSMRWQLCVPRLSSSSALLSSAQIFRYPSACASLPLRRGGFPPGTSTTRKSIVRILPFLLQQSVTWPIGRIVSLPCVRMLLLVFETCALGIILALCCRLMLSRFALSRL